MKPIYIEMNAFGSYQKERIDFDKVKSGLFLITGDTGAGKTTIFDAITYALYDRTSGGKRDGEMMRSQYAAADIKTQVKFKFLYKDEEYTITRSPRQDKWKKIEDESGIRYEKLKTQMQPEVELVMPDGSLYPGKKKDIDEKIEEIIGLTVNQFTQIAMLAQGEFMKLLHASSKERKEIFARIFDTKIYAYIEREINNRAKSINIQLSENRKDIQRELGRIKCVEESAYADDWNLEQYQERFRESDRDEFLELVDNICRECVEKQKKLQTEKELNETKKSQIEEKINAAEAVNKLFTDLDNWRIKKEELNNKSGEIEEKRTQAARATKAMLVDKFYSDFVSKTKEKTASKKRITNLEKWLDENNSRMEILQKSAEEAIAKYDSEAPRLHSEITKLTDSLDKYQELSNLQEQLSDTKTTLDDTQTRLQTFIENVEGYQREKEQLVTELEELKSAGYDILYKEFVENQVAILRAGLKDGEACPVCGSLHHQVHISEEDIRRKKSDKVSLEQNDIAIAEKEKQLKELEEKNNINDDNIKQLSEQVNNLKIEKSKLQAQEEGLQSQLIYKNADEAQKTINDKQKELSELDNQKNTAISSRDSAKEEQDTKSGEYFTEKSALQRITEALEGAEALYKENLKAQGFVDTEDFENAVLEQEEIKELQETINKYVLEVEKANDNINRLEQETIGKEKIDTTEYLAEKARILEEKADIEQKVNDIYNIVAVNNESYNSAVSLYKERESLRKRAVVLNNLDQTANGNIARKHINFQTYIQRRYFKQIISSANKRLYEMSNHQFILQCRELDELGTQGEVGLDLDVYSMVNEQSRDVKTLSGGESFMAALSMALGMADIIQNNAGKIHIDTMFIDEGFGSLSEETRNQAVNILNELSKGNRLVGIISHVSELKAQVETKLEVTKTDKGSKAAWK